MKIGFNLSTSRYLDTYWMSLLMPQSILKMMWKLKFGFIRYLIDQLEMLSRLRIWISGSAVQKDVLILQTEHHRMALQRISEVKERKKIMPCL